MKRTAIINLRKTKFAGSFAENRLIIILMFVYVVGIAAGALFLRLSGTVYSIAQNSFNSFLLTRTDKDFFGIFITAFTSLLPAALILFLCGTSVVGVALSPIAVCYCGFNYGITAAYLYKQYLLQGIAFNSLILIPCTVLAVIGYLISGREAFIFSLRLVRISMPKGQAANMYDEFKRYCKKFSLIILLYVVSALADAVLSVSFLKYFSF